MFLAEEVLWTFGGIWGAIALFTIGLILIIKGGDYFVDAAVWTADELRIPKFLIGATVVSFATTLPELLVSVIAVGSSNFALAVGNAVGSVTANTGLILSLSAIFVMPKIDKKEFGIKGSIILAVGLIMLGFSLFPINFENHLFGIIPSLILFAILGFYVWFTIKNAKETIGNKENNEVKEKPTKKVVLINIIKFIVGALGIVIGAQLLKDNAVVIARGMNISEGIIGITIVAIGTSLPELVTTITAIRKKQGELGVGNIIGANIIDLVLILPICSFISGGNLVIVPQSYILDMPFLILISLVAIIPSIFNKKLKRWQGIVMMSLYAIYITLAAIYFI